MNLKRSLTLILVIISSFTCIAQDYKASIKQRFTEYTNYIVHHEFDKSLDYVPEAIFTIVPRAQMAAAFEQLLNNKAMEVRITGFEINDIGNSRKIDSSYYSLIKYTSMMSMKIISNKQESIIEKGKRLSMAKAAFSNTFGSDNVKLDEATETFTLSPKKQSWAISKNGQDEWKFVNIEPTQRLIMEKLLPKVLIEESIH